MVLGVKNAQPHRAYYVPVRGKDGGPILVLWYLREEIKAWLPSLLEAKETHSKPVRKASYRRCD